jgi:hypothetical protein
MEPQDEIDFWEECYNGEHNNPADCPTWYDWCNCGVTMFNEIERLLADRKGMVEDIKTLKAQNEEMKQLLKTIYETDCLRDWAFEDDDGNSIADKVRKIVKEEQ